MLLFLPKKKHEFSYNINRLYHIDNMSIQFKITCKKKSAYHLLIKCLNIFFSLIMRVAECLFIELLINFYKMGVLKHRVNSVYPLTSSLKKYSLIFSPFWYKNLSQLSYKRFHNKNLCKMDYWMVYETCPRFITREISNYFTFGNKS